MHEFPNDNNINVAYTLDTDPPKMILWAPDRSRQIFGCNEQDIEIYNHDGEDIQINDFIQDKNKYKKVIGKFHCIVYTETQKNYE